MTARRRKCKSSANVRAVGELGKVGTGRRRRARAQGGSSHADPAWDRVASLGASNQALPSLLPPAPAQMPTNTTGGQISSLAQLSSLKGDYSVLAPGVPQLLSGNPEAKSTSRPVPFKAWGWTPTGRGGASTQPLLLDSMPDPPTLRNLCRNFRELLMSMVEMWPYPPSMPSTVGGTSFQYVLAFE